MSHVVTMFSSGSLEASVASCSAKGPAGQKPPDSWQFSSSDFASGCFPQLQVHTGAVGLGFTGLRCCGVVLVLLGVLLLLLSPARS